MPHWRKPVANDLKVTVIEPDEADMAEPVSTGNKLFDLLIRKKVVKPDILKMAEAECQTESVRIEKYLVDKNIVPAAEMTLALSEYLDMPPIVLSHFKPDPTVFELIPLPMLVKHQMIPVARLGKTLTVALADPFDIFAVDEVHILTQMEIVPLVASEKDVRDVLDKSRSDGAKSLDMEDIMKSDGDLEVAAQEEGDTSSIEDMMESAEEAPVVKMVNMILMEALRLRANDIHIEPQADYVRLRYRVDGILIERPHLPKTMQAAITSRVKIMAELDIGEQRIPQDGAFRITATGKKIDVRVSILPTIFGGKVVLRTQDKGALFANIAALGLEGIDLERMQYAIAQPHGILLVTGPTGSGKTSTLYSCLQELNKPDVNIITCEDPVEFQLQGVNQVKIRDDVGMTFAAALRSILRQDPDICLIGEIRDSETCEIAIKAALTGHLVLSTLHANEAAAAVTRLIDMGIEPFLIASSVILAQAQRLYRKLCPVCKKECDPDWEMLKSYNIDPKPFEGRRLFMAQGCPKCHGIGYSGRAAVMEILPIDDHIRTAILKHAISGELRDVAVAQGMTTLLHSILEKVKSGLTSLDAALRVAGSSD